MYRRLRLVAFALISGILVGLLATPTHAGLMDDLVRECDQKSGCPSSAQYLGTPPDPTTLSECQNGPWLATLSVEIGCISEQQKSNVTVACAILDQSQNLRVEYLDAPVSGTIWTLDECITTTGQIYTMVSCSVTCGSINCNPGIEEICIQYACSDCE